MELLYFIVIIINIMYYFNALCKHIDERMDELYKKLKAEQHKTVKSNKKRKVVSPDNK